MLGVSLDTLRRWDRAGKIKVERDAANRRIVSSAEVERLRGAQGDETISARNRFRGVVRAVQIDGCSHGWRSTSPSPRGSSPSSRGSLRRN